MLRNKQSQEQKLQSFASHIEDICLELRRKRLLREKKKADGIAIVAKDYYIDETKLNGGVK